MKKKVTKNPQKVLLAASGGVDSSVAAFLLNKAGYDVTLVFIRLLKNIEAQEKSFSYVQKLSRKLYLPLTILDYENNFSQKVINKFINAYRHNLTPNPCIFCNHFIKFGELYNFSQKQGFDFLATGHYAQIEKQTFKKTKKDLFHLLQANDPKKDQSYFLYRLSQKKLSHLLFPNGAYYKKDVYKIAQKNNIPSNQEESQETCFINTSIKEYLRKHLSPFFPPGDVLNIKGKRVGTHKGLCFYTIGQRSGFSIDSKKQQIKDNSPVPYYIISKDPKTNTLVVATTPYSLFRKIRISNLNWIQSPPGSNFNFKILVRLRSQGRFLPATLRYSAKTNFAKIALKEPIQGISPGQSAVFYQPYKRMSPIVEVLGGGYIDVHHY